MGFNPSRVKNQCHKNAFSSLPSQALGIIRIGQGPLAKCQDNVTEWDITSWCWRHLCPSGAVFMNIIIISPLTVRVLVSPQMTLQPVLPPRFLYSPLHFTLPLPLSDITVRFICLLDLVFVCLHPSSICGHIRVDSDLLQFTLMATF